jgi:GTPase SAR1 family protein
VTDETSFTNLKQWLSEIDRYACENVNIMIVGCKTDMKDQRVISEKQAKVTQKIGVIILLLLLLLVIHSLQL